MAGEVLEHAVAVRAHGELHGGADVGQPATGTGRREPGPQRVEGHPGQLQQLGAALADRHRDRSITVPAVENRTAVDAQQLAGLQHASR